LSASPPAISARPILADQLLKAWIETGVLPVADGLWACFKLEGIEPTHNAAEPALRQSVIQRKIRDLPSDSQDVQSRPGAICRSRLLTVTTSRRQQGRDIWGCLEQAWIAHHRSGVRPSLLPDP
jgi:hypothetical protein